MSYNFRFSALEPYAGEIVKGVFLTLQLSLITMVIGLAIGLFVALGSTSPECASASGRR
jgi:ABC-type amino acid transport system permease subunit